MTRLGRLVASRANYWGSIAIDLVVSIAALIAGFALDSTIAVSLSVFAAAALWYSLLEYGFHRWIYHHPGNVLGHFHANHHIDPSVVDGSPFYYSLSVTGLHGLAAAALFGLPAGLVFGGTLLNCYVQMSLTHHSAHRYPVINLLGPWSAIRRHHALHHHVDSNANFGMTSTLWDRVFGTYVTSGLRSPRTELGPRSPRETALAPPPSRGS